MSEWRRLSDKIIAAHAQAWEDDKPDVAELLIEALELDLSGIGGENEEHRAMTKALEDAFALHHDKKAEKEGRA